MIQLKEKYQLMGFYLIKSQSWILKSLLILEYQLIIIQGYRGFLFQLSYPFQIIYIIYPKSSMSSSSLWEGPLGTPLGLAHWKRASSPVEAGTAGYL